VKTINPKFSAICGLSTLCIFFFVALSIYSSSSFSWNDDTLSDLAGSDGERPIWSAKGASSIIFNIGLIITGILGIIFTNTIKKISVLESKIGNTGTLLLLIAYH